MKLPDSQDAFLLGYLLEVSRDSNGWRIFMQTLLEHFSLRSCHLIVIHRESYAMRFHVDVGILSSDEYAASYIEKYVQQDDVMRKINSSPIGQFYSTSMIDDVDPYQTEYYKNWALPQGITEGATACVYADGDWDCLMASNRDAQQGPYSSDEVRRLNLLLPFVEKALRSSFLLAEQSKSDMRAQAIVNTFRMPVAALTEFGEVWACNSAMTDLINCHNTLLIKDNSLHLNNQNANSRLNMGILQTAKKVSGMDIKIETAERIELDDGSVLAFQELSEKSDGQVIFLGVLVYILADKYLAPISAKKLITLFELTPAESQICHFIMAGRSLKEIASLESKSVHTAREQLNSVFAKTGCSSQVSLVNLLASIPNYEAAS